MKNFKKFILENMSLADAYKFFGLNYDADASDVAKVYRKLSMKYHPDRGGSNEMMSKLNQARDILVKEKGKPRGTTSSRKSNENDIWNPENWAAINKRRDAELGAIKDYIESFLKRFDPEVYRKKIEDIFQKEIYITGNTIKDKTHLILEFADAERDIVFSLNFWSRDSIYDLRRKIFSGETPVLSLAGQIIELAMHSYVYVNGKKQVLQKQYFVKTNDPSIFNDATLLLPTARLQKLASGTVRKGKVAVRDFKAMFNKQFKAYMRKTQGTLVWAIPFPEHGIWVKIFRFHFSFRYTNSTKPLVFYTVSNICPLNEIGGRMQFIEKPIDEKIKRELDARFHDKNETRLEETEETLHLLQNALKQLQKDGNIKKFVDTFK